MKFNARGPQAFPKHEVHKEIEQMTGEEAWWYISFADESGFLGAAIVKAQGVVTAVTRAKELGINPGGAVASFAIPPDKDITGYTDRALTVEDLKSMGGGSGACRMSTGEPI